MSDDAGAISYASIRASVAPQTAHVLQFFAFDHLPPELAALSKRFADLAYTLAASDLEGPELTVGLRKLLEAKDCVVRAALTS